MITSKKSAHKNLKSEILNLKFSSGFTIMEVIVSIFVITLGLVGVLSLVQQNIKAQYVNSNSLVASQLAQEGLELVRNIRDVNWLTTGNDWKIGAGAGANSDFYQDGSYAIDYTGAIDPGVNNITDSGAMLYINNNGFYANAATATTTPFYRMITVGSGAASSTVSCLIQWQERGNVYNYKAETVLYDWK